jgi:2-polyprenyl-3-methyl-5-hydroxy-6-metoxy-1,4-benzoquinol methylase
MEKIVDYISINKVCWNTRTDHHIESEFYQLDAFIKGANSLNPIELDLLGDIKGKKILHLQCHFGMDSLSLARLGAEVVGVDLSDKAIDKAKELTNQLNLDARFICCDLYELPQHLNETFDIVFTSYGTIGWLPDLNKWAAVVSKMLKPSGQFIMADFHPYVWMYDNNFTKIKYSYFNVETIVETESGTYADKEAPIETQSIGWNHPISEILNSLIANGLMIQKFNEYDYSPYNVFPGMEEFSKGQFKFMQFDRKLPLIYAIDGTKL